MSKVWEPDVSGKGGEGKDEVGVWGLWGGGLILGG